MKYTATSVFRSLASRIPAFAAKIMMRRKSSFITIPEWHGGFFLFENMTLPSLRAQTDKDFKIVVMSSDIMPDRFKDRLRAITAADPNVTLDFSDRRNGAFAFRHHIAESLGEGSYKTAVHFRLDDDDALAVGYIARLRALTHGLMPSTHVTFPAGLTLLQTALNSGEGAAIPYIQFLHSVGLAVVCGQTFRKNPFQMMHGDVWRRWPVVSDPSFASHIRVHHFDNDTAENQDRILADLRGLLVGRKSEGRIQKVDTILAEGFAFIDQPHLTGLIGRLKSVQSLADLSTV